MDISILKKLYDHSNCIVTYKDEDLSIMYCNKFMLDFVGAKCMEDIIGKTDYDLPWDRYADLYTKHERTTFKRPSNTALWPICDARCSSYVVICQRTLVEDSGSKGVLTHTNVLKNLHNLELSNLIECGGKGFVRDAQYFEDILGIITDRESECLFYLLRGKTPKSIGMLLGISSRTVEGHVESLRHKFGSASKSELIEKAVGMGFLYYIPDSLLQYLR